MADIDVDVSIRTAAFDHVRVLKQVLGTIPAENLAEGFTFRGERLPLVNPRRGIFKPRAMTHLLSIKTVFPKPGGKVWYDDQREIHRLIFGADETFGYSFMGENPDAADNRLLRAAMSEHVPIIYFVGIAPARYEAIIPTYIVGWDARALRAEIAFGAEERIAPSIESPARSQVSDSGAPYREGAPEAQERRYALRTVKQRLHQTSFREAVLSAYRGRCALSGLPEPRLLDAAHIIEDSHERLGQPAVTNGLSLSKVHHAAFDAHLIGVDPDYRIHVSDRLLSRHDGDILRSLKALQGNRLHPPRREVDAPDRGRLEIRYGLFRAAN